MDLRDPQALQRIRRIFEGVPFLEHLGIRLADLGPGWAETALEAPLADDLRAFWESCAGAREG